MTSSRRFFHSCGGELLHPEVIDDQQRHRRQQFDVCVLREWLETTEGAKFWLKVITELKNRGVQDVLIACCDGLKGFPQAIEAVFPKTVIQTYIVHLIRSSTRFVSYAQRKTVIADLRRV